MAQAQLLIDAFNHNFFIFYLFSNLHHPTKWSIDFSFFQAVFGLTENIFQL